MKWAPTFIGIWRREELGSEPLCDHAAAIWLATHAELGARPDHNPPLGPGQLYRTTGQLEEEWRWSRSRVRRYLERLVAAGELELEPFERARGRRRGFRITVVEFADWLSEKSQPTDRRSTHARRMDGAWNASESGELPGSGRMDGASMTHADGGRMDGASVTHDGRMAGAWNASESGELPGSGRMDGASVTHDGRMADPSKKQHRDLHTPQQETTSLPPHRSFAAPARDRGAEQGKGRGGATATGGASEQTADPELHASLCVDSALVADVEWRGPWLRLSFVRELGAAQAAVSTALQGVGWRYVPAERVWRSRASVDALTALHAIAPRMVPAPRPRPFGGWSTSPHLAPVAPGERLEDAAPWRQVLEALSAVLGAAVVEESWALLVWARTDRVMEPEGPCRVARLVTHQEPVAAAIVEGGQLEILDDVLADTFAGDGEWRSEVDFLPGNVVPLAAREGAVCG